MKITAKKTTYIKQPQIYKPISHSLFSLLKSCLISFLFFTSKVNSHEVLLHNYNSDPVGKLFGVLLAPGESFYCYKGLCLSSKPNTYVCYTIHDVGNTVNIKLPDSYSEKGDPCEYIRV